MQSVEQVKYLILNHLKIFQIFEDKLINFFSLTQIKMFYHFLKNISDEFGQCVNVYEEKKKVGTKEILLECVITVNTFNLLKQTQCLRDDDSPNYWMHVLELSLA